MIDSKRYFLFSHYSRLVAGFFLYFLHLRVELCQVYVLCRVWIEMVPQKVGKLKGLSVENALIQLS